MGNTKDEADKVALFKGQYIDEFLTVEHGLEKIIVKFFIEPHIVPAGGRGGLIGIQKEIDEIGKRNNNIAVFFGHHLFVHSAFSFFAKLDSVIFIVQLLDGNYFDSLKKNGNIFHLI